MAININEFRMGNYAHYSYQGTDVIFYGYNYSDGCFTDFSSIPIEPDELDPIPLTEELLIKLGFEDYNLEETEGWIKWGHVKDNRRLYFSVHKRNGVFTLLETCFWLDEIKYVHQLQNLYFSITGKELCDVA